MGDEEYFDSPIEPREDAIEAAGLYLQNAGNRDESTLIWRDSDDDMRFKDGNNPSGVTLTELAASGSGITEAQHRDLDTLTHEVDESSYDEVIYAGNDVTQYIVWTSASKTLKIREDLLSYSGGKVSQIVSKQYDGSGVLKGQITETYTYSTGRIASVTRTRDL